MSGAVVIKGDSEENIVTGTVNEMTLGEKTDIIVGGFGVCCVGAWVDVCPFKMEAFGWRIEWSGFETHITGDQFHATGSQTHIIVGNETVTVTGDQNHIIRGDQVHQIKGSALHFTTGPAYHEFNDEMLELVLKDKWEIVGGDKYERVEGNTFHYHNTYSNITAGFHHMICPDPAAPNTETGKVQGSATSLALAHNLEITATAGTTSLTLVPTAATLGSAMVNINGAIINLGQPNAPMPTFPDLASILAGLAALEAAATAAAAAAAAAAAEAAAEAAADQARFAAASGMYS